MTLLLDGQPVRGKNLKISASLRIESKDLSGQTSNTATAHGGFKPKSLSVSLIIPYREPDALVQLMSWAQATASGGQRQVYRVVNDTAQIFGVRQVTFADNFSVREDGKLAAWQVSFGLCEKLSTAERVETRRPGQSLNQQAAPGQVASASATEGEAPPAELSAFERVLQQLDSALASDAPPETPKP